MANDDILGFFVLLTVLIAFVSWSFYDSRKRMKNRKKLIEKSKELYKKVMNNNRGLRLTTAHAVKHDYYRKIGYYPNLTGFYNGHIIYIQHATGKAIYPNRMRFYIDHKKSLKNEIRIIPEKNRFLVAKIKDGEKRLIPNSTGNRFFVFGYNLSNLKPELINSLLDESGLILKNNISLLAINIDSFGIELQTIGYVHEEADFIEILGRLINLINILANHFVSIDSIKVDDIVELKLSDKKIIKVKMAKDYIRFITKNGMYRFKKNDLLFIYKKSNRIEIYFENWHKIDISLKNKYQIDVLRAWLYNEWRAHPL
jgi:hypothetical protein